MLLWMPPGRWSCSPSPALPGGCSARGGWRSVSRIGLLFIINQGYWKETVGDAGAGRGARPPPRWPSACRSASGRRTTTAVYRYPAADPRPDADDADLRLPDPGADPVRARHRARPDRHRHLRLPGADPADPSRHHLDAEADDRGRRGVRRDASASCCGRSNCRPPCRTIMAGLTQCIMLSLSMVVIAALIGANGLGEPVVRALNSVNIPLGLRSGSLHRHPGHHPRPHVPRLRRGGQQ